MTMTNDELRALADCLDDPNAMQRTARRKAADYLRAQADAQPVATLTLLDDMGIQIDFRKSFTLLPGQTFFLYTHPAPPVPQAEPIDPHMIVADDRFPDAQAEPKRQPVSEATALIEWPESAKWKNRAAPEGIERSCMAEPKREPLSDERIAEIQRAAYERAAQECIETAAELRRCADGCTDGRYDWKADGALDCADAIRALGRQQ